MKTKIKHLGAFLVISLIFWISTSSTRIPHYYPVFMNRAELERSVVYKAEGRELINTGKIYYKAPYIFINERYRGIHVINNSNPSSPVNEGFILAPGCLDMAVKGNIMYLDNSVDLVAFDLETKQAISRIKNVFPEPTSPRNSYFANIDKPKDFILVGWTEEPLNK